MATCRRRSACRALSFSQVYCIQNDLQRILDDTLTFAGGLLRGNAFMFVCVWRMSPLKVMRGGIREELARASSDLLSSTQRALQVRDYHFSFQRAHTAQLRRERLAQAGPSAVIPNESILSSYDKTVFTVCAYPSAPQ